MKKKTKKIKKKVKKSKKTKRKILKKKVVKKKIVKAKKLTAGERKIEELARTSDELIEKGRKRGFITYDEILKTFPDIENNILFLDELYEKFGVAGIDVLKEAICSISTRNFPIRTSINPSLMIPSRCI